MSRAALTASIAAVGLAVAVAAVLWRALLELNDPYLFTPRRVTSTGPAPRTDTP